MSKQMRNTSVMRRVAYPVELARQYLEISFPLAFDGPQVLPSDNGYRFFSALCGLVPQLHGQEANKLDWQLQGIGGRKTGTGLIEFDGPRFLVLRTPLSQASTLLRVSGQQIKILSRTDEHLITLGAPSLLPVQGFSHLRAHCVCLRPANDSESVNTPEAFKATLDNYLKRRGIDAISQVRERRAIGIKGSYSPGYTVQLSGLSEANSIQVQALGVGLHGHFGGGFFSAN